MGANASDSAEPRPRCSLAGSLVVALASARERAEHAKGVVAGEDLVAAEAGERHRQPGLAGGLGHEERVHAVDRRLVERPDGVAEVAHGPLGGQVDLMVIAAVDARHVGGERSPRCSASRRTSR